MFRLDSIIFSFTLNFYLRKLLAETCRSNVTPVNNLEFNISQTECETS